jgi:hypothetical protein
MFRMFILILITLSAIMVGEKNVNSAARFIPGINGLPLMGGLVLVPDRQVVFDALNGRIIEVLAIGKNSPKDISSFYSATLQQLGWVLKPNNEFWRDEELLKIKISDNKRGQFIVRFSIAPRLD